MYNLKVIQNYFLKICLIFPILLHYFHIFLKMYEKKRPYVGKFSFVLIYFFQTPRKKLLPSGPSVFSPWPRRHKPITTKISSVAVEPVCAVAACAPAFKVVTLSHGVRESCFHHNHHPIACRAD